MTKPFLELSEDERSSANRVHATLAGTLEDLAYWDVFLYSLASNDAVGHDAPALPSEGAIARLQDYVDHYLALIGLCPCEPLHPAPEGYTARVRML